MVKVAVVLSGCGYLDGAEIRESVITLLALDRAEVDYSIFAPDVPQMHVVNHYSGDLMEDEKRNTLVESARIARGKIAPLSDLKADAFDALILPGGFGVAKNLSDLAIKGVELTVLHEFTSVIKTFREADKPIGAICIAPAVLVAALSDDIKARVTLGEDSEQLIAALGGVHESCKTENIVIDDQHNIVSCSAYMQEAKLSKVADGIELLVQEVIRRS